MRVLRIGIHTSRSGSLEKAASRAKEVGANTFQIFSSSPRMWRASVLDPEDVRQFRAARERFDLHPLAIHVNYLVNLASLDPLIRSNSIGSFRGEVERAVQIGADFLVTHPGNFKSCNTEEGIAAFVLGVQSAVEGIDTANLTLLLENTVGGGCQLGGRLSELRNIRDLLEQLVEMPCGYCLDTCHLHGAGFDMVSQKGLNETVTAIETELGFDRVRVIHANDSKGARGSRLDRHANIGDGHIGEEGFRRILNHSAFRLKPFILETPHDEDDRADLRDIATLQRLANDGTQGTGKAKRSKQAGKRQANGRESVRLPSYRK